MEGRFEEIKGEMWRGGYLEKQLHEEKDLHKACVCLCVSVCACVCLCVSVCVCVCFKENKV